MLVCTGFALKDRKSYEEEKNIIYTILLMFWLVRKLAFFSFIQFPFLFSILPCPKNPLVSKWKRSEKRSSSAERESLCLGQSLAKQKTDWTGSSWNRCIAQIVQLVPVFSECSHKCWSPVSRENWLNCTFMKVPLNRIYWKLFSILTWKCGLFEKKKDKIYFYTLQPSKNSPLFLLGVLAKNSYVCMK